MVSKLGVRYTGIFDHISQEDQTICLAQGELAGALWWWDLQIADPVIQCITMALKIGLRLGSYLGPLKHSVGSVFSESLSANPIRASLTVRSTESIESLALVENYIPPGEEAPIDPILASVVSSPPAYHTLPLSTPFYDEAFFGCKCLRAYVRERKTHVDTSVAFLLTYTTPSILLAHCCSSDY